MSPLSTSYDVETLPKTMYLVDDISSSATSMIVSYVPAVMTKGILVIDEGLATEERVAFNSVADNGNDTATLGDLTRGLPFSGNSLTGSASRAYGHTGGASTVRLVVAHELLNLKANLDRTNTWSAAQTIANSVKLLFGGASAYIWTENSGTDLKFKDANNSERTLSQLSALSGANDKVKVSANDTTERYLGQKLTAGDGISATETSDGSDETLDLDIDLAADPGLEFSSSQLRVKIGSRGIVRDSNGIDLPAAGSAGQVLTSNGSGWAAASASLFDKTVFSSGTTSTSQTNPTSATAYDTYTYTIPANELIAGVCFHFMLVVDVTYGTSGEFEFNIFLGGAGVSTVTVPATSTSDQLIIQGMIMGTTTAGASAAVKAALQAVQGESSAKIASDYGSGNFATNGSLAITFGAKFNTSNGSNATSILMGRITKSSANGI